MQIDNTDDLIRNFNLVLIDKNTSIFADSMFLYSISSFQDNLASSWTPRYLVYYTLSIQPLFILMSIHVQDDVIKWKHFPCYWPFVSGIHQSSVNSPHKGQWRGALVFSLICAWTSGWANTPDAGNLRRHCTHYNVTVMILDIFISWCKDHITSFLHT